MYAIIRAGGKQAKVREGDVIDVERIKSDASEVTFIPLLLVNDDGSVVAEADALGEASVKAEIVGEHRGPKVDVFTYKNKSGSRKRRGHRQTYTTIKVTEISTGSSKKAKSAPKSEKPEAADESDASAEAAAASEEA